MATTQAGDLDPTTPKVRTGSFSPGRLERRRRIGQARCAIAPGRIRTAGTWHLAGEPSSDQARPVLDAASVRITGQPENPYEKR
ncbi:hypothetical protein ACFU8Q_09920 [Streptomyces sp. NPDC057543]|uniref:hypothetical protein n=1 Tax=Streptomyces sp. NPDC057543 TaxID=3346163 RepID=UPI0036BDF0BF